MKYRKKPVVIEAVQLTWDNWNKICDFVSEEFLDRGVYVQEDGAYTDSIFPGARIGLLIKTLEGVMLAVQGDYIIKGIKGEFYPCKPDIFEATYEKVEN